MRSDLRDVSVAAFATAIAALIGGIFWTANDRPDAELAWGAGVLAALFGLWRWRHGRKDHRGD
jgi:uncharacterized membrane protein